MRALRIEFKPRRQVPTWVLGCLALVMATLAVHQGWQGWRLSRQATAARREAAALSAELERAAQARRDAEARARVEPPYAKDAAAIAKVAAFPLNRVMRALESVQVQGIKLTTLDIAAIDGTVKLELEYADTETLIRYLEELNVGEPKPRWQLLQAQVGSGGAAMSTATIASQWSEADR